MKVKIVLQIIFFLWTFSNSNAKDHPYCFRMTWLGAYQDKNNIVGLTCEHIREDLTYIPCRRPLVATDNDETPDMQDLWTNIQDKNLNLYGCPMTPGQLCIKYSYIYNKAVQNVTYMCAKVNVTEGCYVQDYKTGLQVEVCVCKSVVGAMPCNIGNKIPQLNSTWWLAICFTIFHASAYKLIYKFKKQF